MVKFSYILPSILKNTNDLVEQIKKLSDCESIAEIIIINNTITEKIPEQIKELIIEIIPETPSFCNGAWNIGAENAKSEYIILATDDIFYDTKFIDDVAKKINNIEFFGLIGIDENILCDKDFYGDFEIEKGPTQRGFGFGTIMFLKKENYFKIPDGIKHWYGDDYLYYMMLENNLVNYLIKSTDFRIRTKIGSMSASDVTRDRILLDRTYWFENYYEKFKIYGDKCGWHIP